MKSVYIVQSVDDNILFKKNDVERLQNGLFLTYCNPLVSLYLLSKKEESEELNHLAMLANLKVDNGNICDNVGSVIDSDYIIKTIIDELYLSSKKSLENNKENSVFITNIVKQLFNSLIEKEKMPVENIMSVEDLMAKLYQNNEEKEQILNVK